jgi:hypothetical protein
MRDVEVQCQTGRGQGGSTPLQRLRVLSGSWLKVLALLSMTCDHAAYIVLRHAGSFTVPLPLGADTVPRLYFLLRFAGRLAFPLFAFLVVEGFLHTRSRSRYGLGLFVFALLSVVPWHLARYGCLFTLASQNVLFTLFLGFLALCAVRRWEDGRLSALSLATVLFTLLATARLMHTDYEAVGVGFILSLYALRHSPALQAAVGIAILPVRWKAGLAFIPINLYNGRRGFIHGTVAKYAFYLYYPLHLLALYFIRVWITG